MLTFWTAISEIGILTLNGIFSWNVSARIWWKLLRKRLAFCRLSVFCSAFSRTGAIYHRNLTFGFSTSVQKDRQTEFLPWAEAVCQELKRVPAKEWSTLDATSVKPFKILQGNVEAPLPCKSNPSVSLLLKIDFSHLLRGIIAESCNLVQK